MDQLSDDIIQNVCDILTNDNCYYRLIEHTNGPNGYVMTI
jgi:hypothetical protein